MQGTIENYCKGWTWNTCVLFFSLFKLCLFALNWRSVRFQNPSCIVRQRMTESFPFPGQRERTQLTPVHSSCCLFERYRLNLFCCMFRCLCAQRWFERPGYFASHADIKKILSESAQHKMPSLPSATTLRAKTMVVVAKNYELLCYGCKARHQMNRYLSL